jgi:ElaB/YqjD/DUF883 family membrane-anchored ribosome-binding protein
MVMSDKTSQGVQFADQRAKTAHSLIDDMQGRMVTMEKEFQSRQKEGAEAVVSGVENRVKTLETFIEQNPAMAAAVAFGIGIFATRFFKGSETWSAKPAVTEEKPKVSKAKAA